MVVRDTHEPLIVCWDQIQSTLQVVDVNTHSTLTQGFWQQN